MADGKVVIETDLDSSGIEKGLKSLGSITAKGLKAATTTIAGTATALAGVSTAAIKVGSDFEAQMSRVKAISGATGEVFDQLRQQAIDLGADTAFSASQAAQGMENLAAAGFETDEIMSAMPGMLDLAAASGEDLAASADIAASTLRGFGLEASEAGHVADVLAENANRTNSSVAETGEAMKYIAPLARAAGISMEETAAAIGIMANAGIQGSQAGTTLRGALSRLSKPTDIMQQAMDELGVSFYDSEGKMLSLAEQVGMLQSAMEGMTDEQKNNYLVTLYGQEALSGMLALINEGPDSLSSLTAAYEACDGSAKAAAETMQDNLKGAVEQLSGSAETLGIVFYDSVAENLKNAAQVATDSVNNITDAFNHGGLNEAISTAGDEFADLASDVASHAPDMVDAAAEFIESFASGVIRNKGELIDSAEEIAVSLGKGLAKILPDELQEPVEDAIDAISDSLESGGLADAGDTIRRSLDTVIDVVGDLAEVALPLLADALDFAGENLNHVAAIGGGAAAGILAYKTAMSAAATATLLAEKAQRLLNIAMNANPVVAVTSAIIAIVSALAIYTANAEQASEEQVKFNAEMDELNDRIKANKDALDNLSDSMNSTNESMNASAAPLERLKGKLDDAFDSTGRVREGSESLANSILNQLNDAMGTEYSLTADGFIQNNDEVIQSLDQVSESIDEYVVSLKQKALSEATSSQYAEAIQTQAEAQETLTEAQNKYNDALENYAQVSADYEKTHDYKALSEAEQRLNDTRDALLETTDAAAEADTKVSGLEYVMDTLGEGTPEAIQKAVDSYAKLPVEAQKAGEGVVVAQQIIQTALASTDYSTMVEGFRLAAQQIEASGGEIPLTLQNSIATAIGKFSEMTPEAQASAIEMMRQMMSGMESTVPEFSGVSTMSSEQILSTFSSYLVSSGAMSGIGQSAADSLASGIVGSNIDGQINDKAREAANSFLSGFDGLDSDTQEIWAQAWYGALKGLEGFEKLKDPAVEGSEAFIESLIETLGVHSPARTVKDVFAMVWPGAVEGLAEGQENLNTTGTSVIQNFLTTLSSGGLLEGAKQIGSNIMSFFGIGVGSQSENSRAKGKANADAANQGAGSVNPTPTGNKFGTLLGNGISAMASFLSGKGKAIGNNAKSGAGSVDPTGTGRTFGTKFGNAIGGTSGTLKSKGKSIANSAKSGVGSVNPSPEGQGFGNKYSTAVGNQSGYAQRAGKKLGTSADSGAKSVSGSGAGNNFGSSFASSIRGWIGSAVSAASALASSALSAIKRTLDIHSPSKKGRALGRNLGESVGLGERDAIRFVEKSSGKLADAALEPLDMTAISNRMRETMALNAGRVAKSFAVETSSTIISRNQVDNTMHLSDVDIDRLAAKMGKVTANEMNKKQNNRPIYLGTDRIDKPLPKGAVPRI